jgi:glycosyltransferase involved in cell wall biosynthesis
MINIVTNQTYAQERRGPYKVFTNLVKGLDILGYPYVINRSFKATRRIWIQDSMDAYRSLNYSDCCALVGPNLVSTPDRLPFATLRTIRFVVPSAWLRSRWIDSSLNQSNVVQWPVGIDTDSFHPGLLNQQRETVLLYFKKRDLEGFSVICNLVAHAGVRFKICIYGSYSEAEYKRMLGDVKFVIWYGCHETQGIGLLETLAMNVPVLVIDDFRGDARTSAPYFTEKCGIMIRNSKEFGEAFQLMLDTWRQFSPRRFVKDSLGLDKQAREFVELWNAWGMSYESGCSESVASDKVWQVPISLRLSDVLKSVVRRKRKGS